MQSTIKKALAYFVAVAMVFTMSIPIMADTAEAAVAPKSMTLKTIALSKTVDIGGEMRVSVKSVKPVKASKSVSWKITKGSSYGRLVDKHNTYVKIKGKKAGTVTIKATSKLNKKITKTIKVKVADLKAEGITLNSYDVSLDVGEKFNLNASVKGPQKYGYNKQDTVWTTSDESVATVNDRGFVTGNKSGTVTITATNDGVSAECKVTVADYLQGFVIAAQQTGDKINYTPVDSDATVTIWNKETGEFEQSTATTVLGDYVSLIDNDGDEQADLVQVVKREDGSEKWDADMAWKDGLGATAYPELDDAQAQELYSAEYRIPFGERQLTEFGITDYCGVNDFAEVGDSPYWPVHDYYNLKSGNGLTILEGYKSQNQATGWSCVMTSALSALEWYGVRGDLNEMDLAAMRGDEMTGLSGGTHLEALEKVFENLTELGITGEWNVKSSKDNPEALYDPEFIKGELAKGNPILVTWNSYGAHGQVIIGYDDMGTVPTADDVLIMMDPYDTTDHKNDGYTLQSYERLAYGLLSWGDKVVNTEYLVAEPAFEWEGFTPSADGGVIRDDGNIVKGDDKNKLNDKIVEKNLADLNEFYNDQPRGPINDLGGAAGYERLFQVDNSPYYYFIDFYNYKTEGLETLDMLDDFKTLQQATEYSCGATSFYMVIEYFDKNGTFEAPLESEMSLFHTRQGGALEATYLGGMRELTNYMNNTNGQDWVYFDRTDLNDPDSEWSTVTGTSGNEYALQGGSSDGGLIPYLIENDIPVMIGWDEWGGHWQTIIGYDDMGTAQTQDDVVILADSYDTTDHDCDGYVVESFERLVYGWNANFELNSGKYNYDYEPFDYNNFIVAFPKSAAPEVAAELGL